MAYIGVSPSNGVRRVHTYTATASQTTFSGAGAEGTSLSYKDSNFVDVYQNGIKLGDADYTSTSGTSIVLAQGASVDDLVVVVVFDVFSVADTVSKADGGTFDGNVTMGGTLDVTGNGTVGGTLGVTGVLTANAGIKVDNITIDGTEIDLSSGDVTIDAALDIKLDAAGGDIKFLSDGTEFGEIRNISSDLTIISSVADKDIIFKGQDDSSEIEAARFDMSAGGQFCVGATSAGLHHAIVSANTGGNAVFKVANTATSGNTTTYISFMDGSGANSVNSAHFQGFNGSNNHYLLGNGTTTFTSDEVAKKNIETTRDGYLEDLAKLRVVKYNWKEDEDGTDKELGLIAQEVEKVFPKLVMLDFDPQIPDKDKKKMIKVSVLPFMLLKALQEANTKIEALEARITALESK